MNNTALLQALDKTNKSVKRAKNTLKNAEQKQRNAYDELSIALTDKAKSAALTVPTDALKSIRDIWQKHTKQYKGYYPYIASMSLSNGLDSRKLVNSFRLLQNAVNILDVGCGVGEALAIMHALAPEVKLTGIEVNPEYVKLGKQYYGDKINLIVADAFDFKGYGDFDGIYTYMPIQDYALLRKLYQYIFQNIKVGTRWLEVNGTYGLEQALREFEGKFNIDDDGILTKTAE